MADFSYRDRTDSVQDKITQLQAAYAGGKHDLAMSLADSLRESFRYERQLRALPNVDLSAEVFGRVEDLPRPWAEWARGWQVFKSIRLFETVGIARVAEPRELTAAFLPEHATDLQRELRVARVDEAQGSLVEVPSQILDEFRTQGARVCRVAFAADVPAHGSTTYLLFSGNPNAELPEYPSDLRVSGEGCGLDIANHYYQARLSRQSGQLERLIFAREHGLELYAGGKGHGEPPGIDWGHDYVDAGGFQKLRMRNWSACPEYEIVRGPLCVTVRRWGFPRSPVHPLFTPSRVHMDVTYTFLAGRPYFLKQSRFDVQKDVPVAAMRDDEWVFSGYSFTQSVWIDRAGKLREGAVPAAEADQLWGVGFINPTSRDTFLALRLSHTAENFDGLKHGGVPTLHYAGHGQLWSRYPVDASLTLRAGASIRQKNAYWLGTHSGAGFAAEAEQLRHQLLNPLSLQVEEFAKPARARSEGTLARPGEAGETRPTKAAIWKALRDVKDEQFYTADANVVDMGYVYDVRIRNGVVSVLVAMPHRGRPVFEFLASQGGGRITEGIRERLLHLEGVRDVIVDATWNPPWSVHRLSNAGRQVMGLPNS